MTLDDAKKALSRIKFNTQSEIVPLERALNHTLASDIIAQKNMPSFDNSALDGYALKRDELNGDGLKIVATIYAGDTHEIILKNGECAKIMTGAKMPLNADCVLRFEDSEVINKDNAELVRATKMPKVGDGHRKMAEEIKAKDIIIAKNTKLSPAHLMLLAAQGISYVSVKTKPSIAVYSSGNELKEPWQTASSDEIYNANSTGIRALLSAQGLKSSYLGIVPDELEAVKAAFMAKFDIIIISGGASKGEADFMAKALNELGFSELFDSVSIRPGKPVKAFANADLSRLFFILPGNPMAAFITAYALLLPILSEQKAQLAILKEDISFASSRVNALLGVLNDGEFSVLDGGKYSSGMILPLIKANAILFTNPDDSELKAGSIQKIYRIS